MYDAGDTAMPEVPVLTPIQRRLIEAAADIRSDEPEEIAYQHSILCQTALPAAKPPEGALTWEKRQGRATLMVQAGQALDPKTGTFTQLALPYGPKARLLLMHLKAVHGRGAVRGRGDILPSARGEPGRRALPGGGLSAAGRLCRGDGAGAALSA
jgi:hypothetical protein